MEKMLTDGATFIDVRGYSANQCRICFEEEELDRVVPGRVHPETFSRNNSSIDNRSGVAKNV
jgi:dihydropteroate synthase